jgi:hypothetical protein
MFDQFVFGRCFAGSQPVQTILNSNCRIAEHLITMRLANLIETTIINEKESAKTTPRNRLGIRREGWVIAQIKMSSSPVGSERTGDVCALQFADSQTAGGWTNNPQNAAQRLCSGGETSAGLPTRCRPLEPSCLCLGEFSSTAGTFDVEATQRR